MVETVVRTAPVAVLVSVIVELGTTAPVASAMWPDMDPEAWANNLEGPPRMPRMRTSPQRTETLHPSINLEILELADAARRILLAWNRVVRGEPARSTRGTGYKLDRIIVVITSAASGALVKDSPQQFPHSHRRDSVRDIEQFPESKMLTGSSTRICASILLVKPLTQVFLLSSLRPKLPCDGTEI